MSNEYILTKALHVVRAVRVEERFEDNIKIIEFFYNSILILYWAMQNIFSSHGYKKIQ